MASETALETNAEAGTDVRRQAETRHRTDASTPNTGSGTSPSIQLRMSDVTRRFGDFVAVDGINIELHSGEVFALLGPSGCGKTTSLRMVAGLEKLDGGSIRMRDRVLADAETGMVLPPERRNIAMVFQSYAVWPHMTVEQNVAFPLRMRKVRRAERRRRVEEILEITGLSSMADRPATALSGGQQQRVALARALVYTPDLMLLDEPLSNLDAKLRTQMRRELRRLNQELGITMLFVTHDQDEALSLADRIAVMNRGRVEQVGTPAELYERPQTPFVRDFLGRVLVIPGVLSVSAGQPTVRLSDPELGQEVVVLPEAPEGLADGTAVGVYCRPEDTEIVADANTATPGPNQIRTRIASAAYLGDCMEYVVKVSGKTAVLSGPRRTPYAVGDSVLLQVDPSRASVWPL
jgi:ABC-type Fe3+/spermidine/putrescine transport system ATPase subunit